MDLMDIPPSRTLADVMAVVAQREARYRELITAAVAGWRVKPGKADWLNAIFGHHGARSRARVSAPLMSNLHLRRAVTRTFIEHMLAHFRQRPDRRRYYSLTFINEFGNTLDRAPQLNIEAFRRAVYKAVAQTPLSAICVLELQAIMNYPRKGRGRTLLLHCHALAWTDDPLWTRDPHTHADKWATSVNGSRSWTSRLGADPLCIRLINATEADRTTVAAYITKPPHDAKNAHRIGRTPRHWLEDVDALTPDLALRLGEGLSQLTSAQVVSSIRATAEAHAWRGAVLSWQRAHTSRHSLALGGRGDVAAMWASLRDRFGSDLYRTPYTFLLGAERPTSVHVGPDPV